MEGQKDGLSGGKERRGRREGGREGGRKRARGEGLQGFWGTREHWQNIEGNKGTLANFWEQGNKI